MPVAAELSRKGSAALICYGTIIVAAKIDILGENVVSGKKLYVSVYNKKTGKYVVDKTKVAVVNKNGTIRIPSLKTGKYKLVTKK